MSDRLGLGVLPQRQILYTIRRAVTHVSMDRVRMSARGAIDATPAALYASRTFHLQGTSHEHHG